jgi:hypothetical protein
MEPFDLSEWSRARVNIDYHVAFDANLYSVPYNLVHELVEIRSTPTTVEILHKGARVASHLRSRGRGQAITNEEHRPKSHRAHLEWTPSRMVHWAETIGPHTGRLFERIMNDKPHPEMGIEDVWVSSGWRTDTPRNAWKPLPSVPCSPAHAATKASNRFCETHSIRCRQPHRRPLPRRRTTTSAARSISTKEAPCYKNR